MFQFFLRDTLTAIMHLYQGRGILGAHCYLYRRLGGGIFKRVTNQVGHDLAEAIAINLHKDR